MRKTLIASAVALALGGVALQSQAQDSWSEALSKAVQDGKASVDFRYRYEYVDEDPVTGKPDFDDEAEASLIRSRLTLESGAINGFHILLEADDVTSVGPNDYNSTENGKTEYPVVADPEGTDLNQAWINYQGDGFSAKAGRQRINLGDQRFVGGVAWRQNEQTFDGGRVQWAPMDQLKIDVSYIYNVNLIFGPDDGANPAELEGDNFFVRADYKLNENHTVTGFGIFLDFDEQGQYAAGKTVNNSSDSYGIEYAGKFNWLSVNAAWATQSEAGDSELDYDADYYKVELGAAWSGIKFKAGYEVLAADNGVGFATPLATAHKFQGWADKFLATPGDGIEDAYASIGGKLGPVNVMAVYHDFQAEDSSADFGTEFNAIATWPVNKQFTLQAKYASFDSDDTDRYADTEKLWLTVQLKL